MLFGQTDHGHDRTHVIVYWPAGLDVLFRAVVFDDEPILTMPENFRDIQRHAQRLGLYMISLRKLSKIMGISKNTLHDYEKGKRYPTAEFVFDYSEATGFPLSHLINRWIRCHPNSNVNKFKRFGHINRHFKNVNGEYLRHEKSNLIGFIREAIRHSIFLTEVNHLSGDQAGKVAATAACIMDKALVSGRNVHPDSITKNTSIYIDPLEPGI